jgi:hypothetical protein
MGPIPLPVCRLVSFLEQPLSSCSHLCCCCLEDKEKSHHHSYLARRERGGESLKGPFLRAVRHFVLEDLL